MFPADNGILMTISCRCIKQYRDCPGYAELHGLCDEPEGTFYCCI